MSEHATSVYPLRAERELDASVSRWLRLVGEPAAGLP